MTVSDLLAITAGFAVTFTLRPAAVGGYPFFIALPVWFVATLAVIQVLLYLASAIFWAVLLRRWCYRSAPRPAEWLIILTALWMMSKALPDVDTTINSLYQTFDFSGDFGWWRWRIASIAAVPIAAVYALMTALRARPGDRAFTVGTIAMLLVLFWGPLPVISLELGSLFPPLTALGSGWTFQLSSAVVKGIAVWPYVILFTLPVAGTYLSWKHRDTRERIWTEWAGVVVASLLGAALSVMFFAGLPRDRWIAQLIVVAGGLLGTLAICIEALRRSHRPILKREEMH